VRTVRAAVLGVKAKTLQPQYNRWDVHKRDIAGSLSLNNLAILDESLARRFLQPDFGILHVASCASSQTGTQRRT
jgi:hypothetical protein